MASDGELCVGDILWRFNENRRRYTTGADRMSARPIWREHWEQVEVLGETRVSWLIGVGRYEASKVAKRDFRNGKTPRGYARSQADIDRLAWVVEERHRIVERVRRCDDYDTLKLIETLLVECGA